MKMTEKEKVKFLSDNGGLVSNLVKRFSSYKVFDYQELYQIARIGFLIGIDKYQPGSNCKLTSYCYLQALGYLQVQIGLISGNYKSSFNKMLNSKDEKVSIDEQIDLTCSDSLKTEEKETLEQELSDVFKNMSELERKIIKYKYNLSDDLDDKYKPYVDFLSEIFINTIKS